MVKASKSSVVEPELVEPKLFCEAGDENRFLYYIFQSNLHTGTYVISTTFKKYRINFGTNLLHTGTGTTVLALRI